ncbi:MAG: response regulator transcription factor [Kiritimatiellae bacterium]|nr:response regulator transcription factor [Kiritimatiellia bacterium]
MADIIVADDDPSIRAAVEMFLASEHHAVRTAANGAEALAAWRERRPQLMILDVMMPIASGWDVCREIRASDPVLPIILLTAKGEVRDKEIGFDSGADDDLVKPFSLREFIARINAALRRGRALERDAACAKIGAYSIRSDKHLLVAPDGTETALSQLETRLLAYLAARRGRVVSKEDMLSACWGDKIPLSRTLDVFMSGLRKKMPLSPEAIKTVRGIGYKVS